MAFGAGHESAGVTAPSPQWFLAEGATGAYFDLFILIAQSRRPGRGRAGHVPAARTAPAITKTYAVGANSRFNIWVDLEDPQLADAAVSTTHHVDQRRADHRRARDVVAGADLGHVARGAQQPGRDRHRHALGDGRGRESAAPRGVETYVLIANTSSFAGDGSRDGAVRGRHDDAPQTFPLLPNSRFNVAMSPMFPAPRNRRFGMLVESIGATPAQIVVERAMYSNAGGVGWAAGTNALATKLP